MASNLSRRRAALPRYCDQQRTIMQTCSLHPDAGLHALQHTFLTEAGGHAHKREALKKLAGYSQIETTMRYIHPEMRSAGDCQNRAAIACEESSIHHSFH